MYCRYWVHEYHSYISFTDGTISRGWIFENHTLKALTIPFKKVVVPGRVKCGCTEGEIVVAHGFQKRKKLICDPEEEIVVAHGRLPSPARCTFKFSSGTGGGGWGILGSWLEQLEYHLMCDLQRKNLLFILKNILLTISI